MKHIYLVLLISLIVVGCSSLNVNRPELSPVEEAAVYAAVIRQQVTVDDTFDGTLQPATVYLVGQTDDGVGDPDLAQRPSAALSPQLREGIAAELADLPAEIVWVASRDEVTIDDETGQVTGNGVIVTLGNLHPQNDGTLRVSSSIYVAGLAAGGQTYVLESVDGAWQVTGTTGVQWIS